MNSRIALKFLFFIASCLKFTIQQIENFSKQFNKEVVKECISQLLSSEKSPEYYEFNAPTVPIQDKCHGLPLNASERIGCCYPNDVKVLYNVMILNKKLVLHSSKTQIEVPRVPPVKSLHAQKLTDFNLPISTEIGPFPTRSCKHYFNGTLHVVGRSTALNVYHAIGDNFAPLVSQILLDHHLAPSYLYSPRIALTGFHPESGSIPHTRLINGLMEERTVDQLDRVCFKRVMWGHGAHVLYYDTLVTLRRQVAEFSHLFAQKLYKLQLPFEFQNLTIDPTYDKHYKWRNNFRLFNNDSIAAAKLSVLKIKSKTQLENYKGLRVVFFTRGSSGKGRSMKGEELIVHRLTALGAKVALCCDYSRATLEEQLAYAVNADVIMGIHGAALVHGFFMPAGGIILELKTLYGFQSGLFPLVADARVGYIGQVDIRDYFVPGGHKPVDNALVQRVVRVLDELLMMRKAQRESVGIYKDVGFGEINSKGKKIVDAICGPSKIVPESGLDHVLGPKLDDLEKVCTSTVLHAFRKYVLEDAKDMLHCSKCAPFNERR